MFYSLAVLKIQGSFAKANIFSREKCSYVNVLCKTDVAAPSECFDIGVFRGSLTDKGQQTVVSKNTHSSCICIMQAVIKQTKPICPRDKRDLCNKNCTPRNVQNLSCRH